MDKLIYNVQNYDEVLLLPNYFFNTNEPLLSKNSSIVFFSMSTYYLAYEKKFIYTADPVVDKIIRNIRPHSFDNNIQPVNMRLSFALINGDIRIIKIHKTIDKLISSAFFRGCDIFNNKLKFVKNMVDIFPDYSESYFIFRTVSNPYHNYSEYIAALTDLQIPERIVNHFKHNIERSSTLICDIVKKYAPDEYDKIKKYDRIVKLKNIFE